MGNIQKKINETLQCANLELKSLTFDNDEKPLDKEWNEGTPLKLNDTILSAQLYQGKCIILAKSQEVVENVIIVLTILSHFYFLYRTGNQILLMG